uniref:Uncharacterized protein n=1 Tax=Leptobrachium leishanense TaxID=445787 RepID=A0A8C5P760_9ANUR
DERDGKSLASKDDILNILLEAAAEARKTTLGPLCPSFNLIKNLRNALLLLLPDNAHQLATGRLYVALTRLAPMTHVGCCGEFWSQRVCVRPVPISAFVFFSQRYFDGACTNFHPFFSLHSVLTVSPFTGEIDICPRDCSISHLCLHALNASFQLSIQNLHRAIYSLFPPQTLVKRYSCKGQETLKGFIWERKGINYTKPIP